MEVFLILNPFPAPHPLPYKKINCPKLFASLNVENKIIYYTFLYLTLSEIQNTKTRRNIEDKFPKLLV